VGGVKVRGLPAWWLWRTYYLLQMPRFDRKLRVMIDWTVGLFFRNDIVKLDLEALPPEVAIEARDRLREQRRR
ncbi:MAG: NAD(P)/FAD-dependent oxidoreductase, partial [Candidatus Sericytochromatia bacterium]